MDLCVLRTDHVGQIGGVEFHPAAQRLQNHQGHQLAEGHRGVAAPVGTTARTTPLYLLLTSIAY